MARQAKAKHLAGRADRLRTLHLPRAVRESPVEEEDSGDKVTYQIVGEDEADLKKGLVNISSPIARALIGKEVGDTAEVQAPGGLKRYEIVAVSYV